MTFQHKMVLLKILKNVLFAFFCDQKTVSSQNSKQAAHIKKIPLTLARCYRNTIMLSYIGDINNCSKEVISGRIKVGCFISSKGGTL